MLMEARGAPGQGVRLSRFQITHLILPAAILFLVVAVFVLEKTVITSLVMTVGILGACLLLTVSDDVVVGTCVVTSLFYFDFFRGHELSQVLVPLAFGVLFVRRLLDRRCSFAVGMLVITPFTLCFLLAVYWYTQTGSAPTAFQGSGAGMSGNFRAYYNNALNYLTLLLPFLAPIRKETLIRILEVCLLLYLVQSAVLVVRYALKLSFYVPVFLPYGFALKDVNIGDFARIGEISTISSTIVILVCFFGSPMVRRLKWPIVAYALALNIIWGGGRIDLICSLAVLAIAGRATTKTVNLRTLVAGSARLLGAVALVVVMFSLFSSVLPEEQQERFAEILHPQEAYKRRAEGGRGANRIRMWEYGIRKGVEAPIMGHGIAGETSSSKYNAKFERFVAIGAAHNKYVSLFYIYGLLGFVSFLWGISRVLKAVFKISDMEYSALWRYITVYFIVTLCLRWFFEGGVVAHEFLTYFLAGYVLSYALVQRPASGSVHSRDAAVDASSP